MFMRAAALTIDPVSATAPSNSALPGPSATSFPQVTRNRGEMRRSIAALGVFFMVAELKVEKLNGILTLMTMFVN
jgi:hypothetical protein